MSGRPRDWEIEKAVRECLKAKGTYKSLSALHADVSGILAGREPPMGTTPERIRKIGIEKKLFTVEISYSRRNSLCVYEDCPVCGGKLSATYNRTIDGDGVAVMGAKCSRCGYDVRSGFMRPSRYSIRKV
jgi:rRNA maturation protein Nop10